MALGNDDCRPSVELSSHLLTRLSWLASHESVSAEEIAFPMNVQFGDCFHSTEEKMKVLLIDLLLYSTL